MIFTSVDVEAVRYLRAQGQIDPDFEKYLLDNISFGYQRELTYRHEDGWFNAHVCDSAVGSLWLTSYCLSVFSQARDLVTIDADVLAAASAWIVEHQQGDGGWTPVGWVHNSNLYGGLKGDYALTAFVALALAEHDGSATALAQARGYLESKLEQATDAPALATGAYALARLGSPVAEQAVDRLLALAKADPEDGVYWEPVPVETTAYACLALYETGRPLQGAEAATWLAGRKNSRGGFGTTQDTVMALRALVRDAIGGLDATDLSIDVRRGDQTLFQARVDRVNFDVAQSFPIPPGPAITVEASGKGPATLQLARIYHMPTEMLLSRGGIEMDVVFERTLVAIGETVSALARIRYTGPRPATNMAVAEIGIPTGLRPDRDALGELVGQGRIQRIDVKGRTIIVYIDKIESGETVEVPISYTAAFTAQPVPAPSKAYDYYAPGVEALDEGRALILAETGDEIPFIRGDANGDQRIDLGDAIGILDYLFPASGFASLPCADVADINDDGITELGDPIALLMYMFSNGTPPAAPFPQLGRDPTPDTLPCVME
ncbi:MAG: hypothetical protein JXP34_23455 [Planctomycetes bacterium]|nr:hypothetical protein [Planctomycetota bacterium]